LKTKARNFRLKRKPQLLGLNRSSFYYKPVQPSKKDVKIKHRIDEIYTAYLFYGSRRIQVQLKREGEQMRPAASTTVYARDVPPLESVPLQLQAVGILKIKFIHIYCED
jgi:hypothetical protein